MVADLAFATGLAAIVAGVAFIYWPAALIMAGGSVCAIALLLGDRS